MKKAILPALTLAAAVALPQTAEAIKLYFSQTHTSGSQTGHLMQDNCGGCPKGDKIDTLPTGLVEYVLSSEPSMLRQHYANYANYTTSQADYSLTKNEVVTNQMSWDVEALVAGAPDLFAASGTDITAVLAADTDGVLLSRAVARTTAEAANQMFAKKGRAQWFWGRQWFDNGDGTYKLTLTGGLMNLVVYDEDEATVALHVFSKGISVRDALGTWDVSGLDLTTDLTYEQVAAGIREVAAE